MSTGSPDPVTFHPGARTGVHSASPGSEAHSGIHDGTYYPDGIPPASEHEKLQYAREGGEQSSTEASSDEEEALRREQEVLELARRYTTNSTYSAYGDNPLDAEKDSLLDPLSPNFKARAWAKSFMKLHQRDPDKHPERTAGIVFKDLNVHGYGAATDYQKSVGNVWMEAVGVVRSLLGVGQRRIDILRDFDGLVESGEMLVVLGPPGSGCSTLLKTIAGETHGFVVDENSYLNYQGSNIVRQTQNPDNRG